jgi:hypothetical protein
VRSTPGAYASVYARSSRSPKRIFLPRRHALKGLGLALMAVLLIAAIATGLSHVDMASITATPDSDPADTGRDPARPRPQAGVEPRHTKKSPTPTKPASPKPPAHKRPHTPARKDPAPAPAPVQPAPPATTEPTPTKAPRADLFSSFTDKFVLKPEASAAEVWMTNTKPVTDLRLKVRVVQTGGVANSGIIANDHADNAPLPAGDMTMTVTQSSGAFIYEFALNDGVTLQPGTYQLVSQYTYAGAPNTRYTAGDSYSMTAKEPGTGAVDSVRAHFK